MCRESKGEEQVRSAYTRFAVLSKCLAAALLASLVLATNMVCAAEKDARDDHVESRIKDMRGKLKITAAQEVQWSKVAQAMRDDGKTVLVMNQARPDQTKYVSAVENLNSFAEIAAARADGIKKLAQAFSALYTSMSPEQKKEADKMFSADSASSDVRSGENMTMRFVEPKPASRTPSCGKSTGCTLTRFEMAPRNLSLPRTRS